MPKTASLEKGFKTAGVAQKEAVADSEGQVSKDMFVIRDIGLVGKGGESDELRDFMQSFLKKVQCCTLHVLTGSATHAKSLLEMSKLWGAKATQTKRIEVLMQHLTEKLSVWERSFAD